MTDFFLALFLGFVEGLTEFLPVSSTAHLLVLTKALNFSGPPGHVFEIFIQLGAIFAVVVLYRRKLWQTAIGFPTDSKARSFTFNLIAGTIPALVAGLIGRDWIKSHLYNPTVIATTLIIGGVIILILDKRLEFFKKGEKIESVDDISLKTAMLIGCFQSIALIPGVSRSGATIMGSLALGLSRPAAAEFSFFLAIPVMCAAVALDTLKSWHDIINGDYLFLMLSGFVAAFISALIVVRSAIYIISHYGFTPFAWYRILAGLAVFIYFL